MDSIESEYQRRILEREKFKNKYLKIHRNEFSSQDKLDLNMPVDKMYNSYLNNQIQEDKVKRYR